MLNKKTKIRKKTVTDLSLWRVHYSTGIDASCGPPAEYTINSIRYMESGTNHCKGDVISGVSRLMAQKTAPLLPWQTILRRYFSQCIETKKSEMKAKKFARRTKT